MRSTFDGGVGDLGHGSAGEDLAHFCSVGGLERQ